MKDFLESFVGLALNPIAMSICTEKNGGAIVVRAGWISASSSPITCFSRMRHFKQDFLTVVIVLGHHQEDKKSASVSQVWPPHPDVGTS